MRGIQKAGKDYEIQIATAVYNETDGDLVPIPAGFSGNHKIPSPDVLLFDGTKFHAFEFKRTTKDRYSVLYDPDGGDDDISQLLTFAQEHPGIVVPHIGIRFTQRQLILCQLWGESDEERMLDAAVMTCPTEAKVTRSDNLSFQKPPTRAQDRANGWPSARSGDDVQYVLEEIGYVD